MVPAEAWMQCGSPLGGMGKLSHLTSAQEAQFMVVARDWVEAQWGIVYTRLNLQLDLVGDLRPRRAAGRWREGDGNILPWFPRTKIITQSS